jgi:hypothetical protein
MTATLLYVLLATSQVSPSTVVLATSSDPHFCERVKTQIEHAPRTQSVYSCETLVSPTGLF